MPNDTPTPAVLSDARALVAKLRVRHGDPKPAVSVLYDAADMLERLATPPVSEATAIPVSAGVLVEAAKRLLEATDARSRFGREHVPSMREEQDARWTLRQALSTTATPASDGVQERREAGWVYEHDSGAGWERHVVLNTLPNLPTKRAPTKHYGSTDIRNVQPFYFATPDRFGEGYRAGVEAATIAAQLTKAQREAIGTVLPSRSVKGSAVTLQALWDKGLIKGGYNLQFGADPTPNGLAVRAIILKQSA